MTDFQTETLITSLYKKFWIVPENAANFIPVYG